jgi:peptide deformylase
MAPDIADCLIRRERKKNAFDRVRPCDYQTGHPRAPTFKSIMAIRPILILPDPHLRLVCAPVLAVDDGLRRLMDDMVETMHDAPGIGLAASQIGVMKRVVVIDLAKKDEPPQPQYFVNPEIVWSSEDKSTYEEGCLSIPEYYEEVERPARVRVRFLDRDGRPQEILAEGLLATAIQHEIDHLDGVLFIDHISKLKRDRVTKKFIKQAKQRESEKA